MAEIKINFFDDEALRRLKKAGPNANKQMNRLIGDLKDRVPGWIASGIMQDYNIKKSTIEEKSKLRITSGGLQDLEFKYTGRRLTPASFKMSPKTPPTEKGYTLNVTIKKGKKVAINQVKKPNKRQRRAFGKNFTRSGARTSKSSPWMLQRTGAESADGITHIPFQRTAYGGSHSGGPMSSVLKTIAVPQMIKDKNGNLKPGVAKKFNTGVEKRFYHYTDKITF